VIKLPVTIHYSPLEDSVFGKLLIENGWKKHLAPEPPRVYTASSLVSFWVMNFGNDGRKRRIPDDFWMFQSTKRRSICGWHRDLANQNFAAVGGCLAASVSWPPETQILFFGGVEVIDTTWQFFTTHWNSFVECNDEGILCCKHANEGAMVSPHGYFIVVRE